MKPRVFIASSTESLEIAYALQSNLEVCAEVTVWSQGVFGLSSTVLDDLIIATRESDFGVFVFSPEDVIKIRDQQFETIRDNVIFELGLFIGRLGKERNFLVAPRSHHALHLPTDLMGINLATFDALRSDSNLQAALGPVSNRMRTTIQRIGGIKHSDRNQRALSEHLINTLRRIVEMHQPPYSDILIENWTMIHSIDEQGNGHLDEELTLVPVTRPLYFYLMDNSATRSAEHDEGITLSARSLTSGLPLTVVELQRSDTHVSSVIVLDPPSTVENPQRIAITCDRIGLWKDLAERGEDQGFLRSSNKSDSLHLEFIAPAGRKWKAFNPAPAIGTTEIVTSTDRSRITWDIQDPPSRRYSYKLFLEKQASTP